MVQQASGEGLGKSPQPVVSKVALPRPPKASGVIGIHIPQPRKVVSVAASESFPFIFVEVTTAIATCRGVEVMPHSLASIPTTASLPKLVREF